MSQQHRMTAIEFLVSKGIDPFEIDDEGRPAWEQLEDICAQEAAEQGLRARQTKERAWHPKGGFVPVLAYEEGEQ